MTLKDIEAAIKSHQDEHGSPGCYGRFHSISSFGRWYRSEITTGLSLQAIGDQLRAKEFSADTLRILSWYCGTDLVVFTVRF